MTLESKIARNALLAVTDWYGTKTAERSGAPLINHIIEGCYVLDAINADCLTKAAFCYHPMFQNDNDLMYNRRELFGIHPWVVTLIMEYRNVANRSLSDIVIMGWDGNNDESWQVPKLKKPIKLSPLFQVNQMLVADKVQNRKDFTIYHKDNHARSVELTFYFEEWLKALNAYDKYPDLLESIYTGIKANG